MAVAKKIASRKINGRLSNVEAPAEVEDVPATDEGLTELARTVAGMIKDGALDFGFDLIEAAYEDRLMAQHNANLAAAKKAAVAKVTESSKVAVVETKKLPAAPVARKATVVPVEGKAYLLIDKFPKIGGAKVKFVRVRKDDANRAVVEMLVGAPGAPAGKQIVVPIAALKDAPVAKRIAATAVAPARKVAAPAKTVAKKAVRRASK